MNTGISTVLPSAIRVRLVSAVTSSSGPPFGPSFPYKRTLGGSNSGTGLESCRSLFAIRCNSEREIIVVGEPESTIAVTLTPSMSISKYRDGPTAFPVTPLVGIIQLTSLFPDSVNSCLSLRSLLWASMDSNCSSLRSSHDLDSSAASGLVVDKHDRDGISAQEVAH